MSKRLRILLDGYIDGNFGDDLMLYLAANGLKEPKLYITSPKLDIAEYTEEKIGFDPEGSMFCVYSKDKDVLADFILRFKKACEDKPFILDLFSRAELD